MGRLCSRRPLFGAESAGTRREEVRAGTNGQKWMEGERGCVNMHVRHHDGKSKVIVPASHRRNSKCDCAGTRGVVICSGHSCEQMKADTLGGRQSHRRLGEQPACVCTLKHAAVISALTTSHGRPQACNMKW